MVLPKVVEIDFCESRQHMYNNEVNNVELDHDGNNTESNDSGSDDNFFFFYQFP